jgi:type I restriction enzyme R subunit
VLEGGEKLTHMTEAGTGSVHKKERTRLLETIEQVNELFEGDLTENDKLVYVNNAIKGKLLESETLSQQATNNTKEQFANSPGLANEILSAIMDALTSHTTMSTQTLNSERIRNGIRDTLLGPANLYEDLRERAVTQAENKP